jgi:hypothetical protein
MTLQRAWDELKELMERGIEEGKVCGYDTPSDRKEHGMYKVYDRVLDKMKRLEKEIK